MPPKYVCAAIIAEVIDFLYPDKVSGPSQRKAWSAAEGFWKSRFEPEHWGDDPSTGWKDYFGAVDGRRFQSLRGEVRRVLSISASLHTQSSEEK
jgi:hypothetical protein